MPNELDAVALERAAIEFRRWSGLMHWPATTVKEATASVVTAYLAALASAKPAQAGEYEGVNDHLRKSMASRGLAIEGDPFPPWMSMVASFDHERKRAEAAEARVPSLETRLAAMGEALKGLTAAATVVSRYGAQTGPQWTQLAPALGIARAILSTEASHHG